MPGVQYFSDLLNVNLCATNLLGLPEVVVEHGARENYPRQKLEETYSFVFLV